MINKRGKWVITKTVEIYKTPWVTVIEDKVVRPDGKDGVFTRIDILPGISILPMDEDQNVYLASVFVYSLNDFLLINGCSGGVEIGETPFEAAERELKEETGLVAKKWTELGLLHSSNSTIIASPAHMFLAQDLEIGEKGWDGGEDMKLIKVPLKTAVEWVMSGKITHAGAQAIILKADKYLHP